MLPFPLCETMRLVNLIDMPEFCEHIDTVHEHEGTDRAQCKAQKYWQIMLKWTIWPQQPLLQNFGPYAMNSIWCIVYQVKVGCALFVAPDFWHNKKNYYMLQCYCQFSNSRDAFLRALPLSLPVDIGLFFSLSIFCKGRGLLSQLNATHATKLMTANPFRGTCPFVGKGSPYLKTIAVHVSQKLVRTWQEGKCLSVQSYVYHLKVYEIAHSFYSDACSCS